MPQVTHVLPAGMPDENASTSCLLMGPLRGGVKSGCAATAA
jgi:hypothetical protein